MQSVEPELLATASFRHTHHLYIPYIYIFQWKNLSHTCARLVHSRVDFIYYSFSRIGGLTDRLTWLEHWYGLQVIGTRDGLKACNRSSTNESFTCHSSVWLIYTVLPLFSVGVPCYHSSMHNFCSSSACQACTEEFHCYVWVKLICCVDVAGLCQTMTLLKHITASPLEYSILYSTHSHVTKVNWNPKSVITRVSDNM